MKIIIDGELLNFTVSLSVNLDKVEIVSNRSFCVVSLSRRNEVGSVGKLISSGEVGVLKIVAVDLLGDFGLEFTVILLFIIDSKYT